MSFAVIMLAAGLSRRYGHRDKLEADLGGKPVLAHALSAARDIRLTQKHLIIPPDRPRLAALGCQYGFQPVENPAHADGMGTSIAVGMQKLRRVEGVFIALGDMPFIPVSLYGALRKAFVAERARIIRPRYGERPGHPVLFSPEHFPALLALSGDMGAKTLISGQRQPPAYVDVADRGVLIDIDTPRALTCARMRLGRD